MSVKTSDHWAGYETLASDRTGWVPTYVLFGRTEDVNEFAPLSGMPLSPRSRLPVWQVSLWPSVLAPKNIDRINTQRITLGSASYIFKRASKQTVILSKALFVRMWTR
jgi:hypothetical protein